MTLITTKLSKVCAFSCMPLRKLIAYVPVTKRPWNLKYAPSSCQIRSYNCSLLLLNHFKFLYKSIAPTRDALKESLNNIQPKPLEELNGVCDPEQVLKVWENLLNMYFNHAVETIPWLYHNRNIAKIQLQVTGLDESLVEGLWCHDAMPQLINLTIKHIENMNNTQLTSVYLNSLYLGLDKYSDLAYKLHFESDRRVPFFSCDELLTYSFVLKALFENTKSTQRTLQKLKLFIDDYDFLLSNANNLKILSEILLNSKMRLSDNMLMDYYKAAYDIVRSKPSHLQKANHVSAQFRILRMKSDGILQLKIYRNYLGVCLNHAMKTVHEMSPEDIRVVTLTLKLNKSYPSHIAEHFWNRGLELLSENSRVWEVVSAAYSVRYDTPLQIRRIYQHELLLRLQDVDPLTLSHMAEIFMHLRPAERDIWLQYQWLVSEQIDNILKYLRQFTRIFNCLATSKFPDPQVEQRIIDAVINEFESSNALAFFTLQLASMAGFLLSRSNQLIHPRLFRTLLMVIPYWNINQLYKTTVGLNNMPHPKNNAVREQIAQIQHCLHETILERLENPTPDMLFQLCMGLVIHNPYRDPILTDKLMSLFLKFLDSKNSETFIVKMATSFKVLRYYLEQVYEHLADFVIGNPGMALKDVCLIASTLAQAGHVPMEVDAFEAAVLPYFEEMEKINDIDGELQLLLDLMILQIFPEKRLTNVFSLEAIEAIDAYISEFPHCRAKTEQLVMELNRATLLECPQLEVPWFNEVYCRQQLANKGKQHALLEQFRDEVGACLEQLCGGEQYIYTNTFSPYYYPIDFEMMLNQGSSPVIKSHTGTEESCHRVAVLLTIEENYCYNSWRLLGQEQMKIRHLQIMGYKVVLVPYYDWYSMGCIDIEDKIEFLERKIFEQ